MTPGARLQAVLDIITEAAPHKAPLDQICSAYFRSRRYIGSKDRAYISDFVYATYRNYRKLEWLAQTQSRGNRIRLIVLFACILLQDWKLYDFQNYLGKGDYDMAPIDEDETEILRRVIGEKHLIDYPPAVANECPDWAYDKLKVVFGDSLNDEMAALNQNATVDLRVNTLKATRDEVFAELLGTGIEVEATPYSPVGLRLKERAALGSLESLQDGRAEVQDEGSQMIAILCEAKPGLRVLDYCAGAGGKSLALAAEMQNKGRLIACDNHSKRLQNAVTRFRRAGVSNHETKLIDADIKSWLKRNEGKFDRVLVDAPCSGSGTWRRNPDAKFRYHESDLAEFTALQTKIMNEVAPLVKSGGHLIYATCSLFGEENEKQIESFLAGHPEFKIKPLQQAWANENYMRLSPLKHRTDAFFAAVLTKA